MISTRKIGGGTYSPYHSKKGGTTLIHVPLERPTLMRGGQRWDNTSMNGGVMNG